MNGNAAVETLIYCCTESRNCPHRGMLIKTNNEPKVSPVFYESHRPSEETYAAEEFTQQKLPVLREVSLFQVHM
jgi:predicted metal-binding transcription factor (methanogenesis marker protein 9)